MDDHWTDHAATPVFTTRIPAGNIVEMVGFAGALLRQIGIPGDRITRLYENVTNAASYDQAIAFIEHYFPVDRDGDDAA